MPLPLSWPFARLPDWAEADGLPAHHGLDAVERGHSSSARLLEARAPSAAATPHVADLAVQARQRGVTQPALAAPLHPTSLSRRRQRHVRSPRQSVAELRSTTARRGSLPGRPRRNARYVLHRETASAHAR